MTKLEKARLAALLGKSTIELTDAEMTELTTLRGKALAEKITLDAAFIAANKEAEADPNDSKELTDAELGDVVGKAMSKVLAEKGIDQTAIIESIKANNANGITAGDVQRIVQEAVKGLKGQPFDSAALLATVTEAVKAQQGSALTQNQLIEALTKFAETQNAKRTPSLNQYPDGHNNGVLDLVEHRGGNLPVA
jgi:hypothetical protein